MKIKKNSTIFIDTSNYHYLVPNFTETKSKSGWIMGGDVNSSGVAVLTGTGPALTSPSFEVNPNDIIVVEFDVSLPTTSTGDGIFLGIAVNANTISISYNSNNNTFSTEDNASTPWNTYFLYHYNSNATNHVKGYILGSNVDISKCPVPSAGARAIKLKNYTTTNIRTGYNANSSMVINISNFKVYPLNMHGISDLSSKASIGKGYLLATNIIEY